MFNVPLKRDVAGVAGRLVPTLAALPARRRAGGVAISSAPIRHPRGENSRLGGYAGIPPTRFTLEHRGCGKYYGGKTSGVMW